MKNIIQTALLVTFLVSALSNAEVNYVKDELYVPLRSGPTNKNRIIHKGLRSGLKLEVLSESEDQQWVQIKTPSGLEGWIQRQYVSKTPTSAIFLQEVRSALKETKTNLVNTQNTLEQENNKRQALEKKLSDLESTHQNTKMELHRISSISSGAIELDKKYQKLLEEHELLRTENDTLNAENSALKDDRRFSFMFYGAALVLLGVLITIIVPRIPSKKRNSEWVN